ncbi:MAG: DUF1501 domain-containing protein [Pirellulaceae bacterium]
MTNARAEDYPGAGTILQGEQAMLVFQDSKAYGRREFLRIGGLTLGAAGSWLPWLAAQQSGTESLLKDRSVIFLFLHGGPSQFETFDPKMSAPAEIRSATGEIETRLPGVTFGGTFPRLASLADRVSIVRSFTTGDGNHDIKPVVSRATAGANIGSIYARVAGANHPQTGMPRNCALFPRSVDPDTQPNKMSFGKFNATGPLGSAFAPFIPGDGSDLQDALKLTMPRERLDDRRLLLAGLDRIKREVEPQLLDGADKFQSQAFDTIIGGVAEAFDLAQEDPRIVAGYDTAPRVRPDQISKRWNNYNNYVDNAKSLGKLLLLARRLCERGCGFVTVTTNFVWDMHADVNNAGVEEGMQYMGSPLDHALAAYIDDVEARGLSDRILLVACGEMGRTPKINARGGRDHWGGLAPLLVHGGGLAMGQVVGQSSRDGGQPATTPYRIPNLIATIMHALLEVGKLRLIQGIPAEVGRSILEAEPIQELVG